MKNKTSSSLRKAIFKAAIVFVISILQFYGSMDEYSDSLSSACLDCSFVVDVIIFSAITAFMMAIVYYLVSLIKNGYVRTVVEFLSLIAIWLFWDYSIFVDRESSWSTYLFTEEVHYVMYLSGLPVLILSILATLIIYKGRAIVSKFF